MVVEPIAAPSNRWRRLFRFRLRTFFIVVTLLCAWIAIATNGANRQRRAVEAIVATGGQFLYDYQRRARPTLTQFTPDPFGPATGESFSTRATPPGNPWLRRLVGDHYFITPVSLHFSDQRVVDNDGLAALAELSELTSLGIGNVELSSQDLAHIRHLSKLQTLALRNTLPPGAPQRDFSFLRHCTNLETITTRDADFGDAALKHIIAPNMRSLYIYETGISDDGMVYLKKLVSLERLGISRTKITDAGLAHIAALPNLQYLSANSTAITDAGIESIKKMANLTTLEVNRTAITKKGVAEIQFALPNCNVVR